ncbi:MAG: hypothetical protein ABR915_24255 [Thermoguttaceae bacterium]|jgi:hypothetical protein
MSEKLADVRFCCGRYVLFVAGIAVAMEGDKCRDGNLPERVLAPIPEEELAAASIEGKPAKDLPIGLVRFFRGDCWNRAMLEWVAERINAEADRSSGRGEKRLEHHPSKARLAVCWLLCFAVAGSGALLDGLLSGGATGLCSTAALDLLLIVWCVAGGFVVAWIEIGRCPIRDERDG